MFIINPNNNHWLIGKCIGKGAEHTVYAKGKYVYKIRRYESSDIFDLIEFIIIYLRRRNSILFQLPAKFVGLAYMDKHIYPIFKQLKTEPISQQQFNERVKNINKINNRYIKDMRLANFGILNGEIFAIDVELESLSEIDNFYDK